MQRRGPTKRPVKGQRTKRSIAAKASAAHSPNDLVERLKRERDEAVELQAASAEGFFFSGVNNLPARRAVHVMQMTIM